MLIQDLPTQADIEALISKVEEAHGKELQVIHGDEIQTISEHLAVDESVTHSLEQRVTTLEKNKISHTETAKVFQLQLEGLEDRSRRTNV